MSCFNTTEMDQQTLSRRLGGTHTKEPPSNPPYALPLTPPTTFPPTLPAPTAIPLRPPPLTPNLARLDAHYNTTLHPILPPQNARRGYDASLDETTHAGRAALDILEQHVHDRAPYVQLVGARLQAIVGARNENVFELPAGGVAGSPLLGLFPDLAASVGTGMGMGMGMGGCKKRRDSGVNMDAGLGAGAPKTLGMHVVDKETGHGLREFLLQKGKEMGVRKRECRAISFHDFTPDIRTNRHANVLVAHYEVRKPGERCDVYEVDL
jgi:hypothetical protein